jgi:hypothetical protein
MSSNVSQAEAQDAPRRERGMSAWNPYAMFLIAVMAVGSGFMWVGLPLLLVYLASQVASSSQPSMGPYMIIIIGLPVGMFAIGKGLGALDRHYGRLRGRQEETRQRAKWLRSMRGERAVQRPNTVLDVVMVVSVGICLLVAAVWFFAFAGDPTPGG